ncbi:3-hydroxy-5-phosphonooxypentane-2,4-dione thiolase [Sediminispirochaeta bajacaliforniensis]|uniref:3-hydroxy-5-phosphonooxypentane-2,4-dione thiolase n=1 Tax=Sediminispirochaeta bajacaliforniensis TaxID=148 RepID=UPI000367C0AD|nr:3-hydroxy-5-phosphonooxypentane-2,4-dione thiolase [Sediminispirochaeta bajacaliforniensis]
MFDNISWGKKRRLSQIVKGDGRALMLAIDHGYFMGSTTGMEVPSKAIEKLLPYTDSLMLSPGVLTSSIDPDFGKGCVLRASGGNTILDKDIDDEGLILTAEEAVRLNASAVAVSIFVGAEHSHQTILNLSTMISDAARFDLPVLGVTAVGKALKDKKEKRYLAHASRIAAELGADIVKTYYCDGFEEVVTKTPVPIVVAGGPKLDTYEDVLTLCYRSIQEGAIGVDMGRNIWQSEYPSAIIQGVQKIIHENFSVKQALEYTNDLCNEETKRVELFKVTARDIEESKLH